MRHSPAVGLRVYSPLALCALRPARDSLVIGVVPVQLQLQQECMVSSPPLTAGSPVGGGIGFVIRGRTRAFQACPAQLRVGWVLCQRDHFRFRVVASPSLLHFSSWRRSGHPLRTDCLRVPATVLSSSSSSLFAQSLPACIKKRRVGPEFTREIGPSSFREDFSDCSSIRRRWQASALVFFFFLLGHSFSCYCWPM